MPIPSDQLSKVLLRIGTRVPLSGVLAGTGQPSGVGEGAFGGTPSANAGKFPASTIKVYNGQYKDYCLKDSSNLNFNSKYYWNVKLFSENLKKAKISLVSLRPNLKMIQKNLMTGQELLKKIIPSEPDDRTSIWLADVLGSTGKTVFFLIPDRRC